MPPTMDLDVCGRRRSPATLSGFHYGLPPRNKGQRYPADPPTVEEIIAVMHAAGDDHEAVRLRGADRRALARRTADQRSARAHRERPDLHRGAILIRHGKGGKRREVGMDRWAWEQLSPGCSYRATLPVGALFCVLAARPRGRAGRPPASARSCTTPPPVPGSDAGSRRISCATRTRSRCRARACRCYVIQRQLGHYAGDPVKCDRLGGKRARHRGSGRSTLRRAVVPH